MSLVRSGRSGVVVMPNSQITSLDVYVVHFVQTLKSKTNGSTGAMTDQ